MSAIKDKLNNIFKFDSLERVITLNKEVRGIVLHRRSFCDNRSNEYTIMADGIHCFLYFNEEQLMKEE